MGIVSRWERFMQGWTPIRLLIWVCIWGVLSVLGMLLFNDKILGAIIATVLVVAYFFLKGMSGKSEKVEESKE